MQPRENAHHRFGRYPDGCDFVGLALAGPGIIDAAVGDEL